MTAPVRLTHFSDVLCVWAYVSEIRLQEVRQKFGERLALEYRFTPIFGNARTKLQKAWSERGGLAGYSRHVRDVAARFPHVEVHPEIWTIDVPHSSASCHHFLKAVQLLGPDVATVPVERFEGRTLFEELAWRLRLAFFREARDVSHREEQLRLAAELDLDVQAIREFQDSGAALAALHEDLLIGQELSIKGSPTYVLNEARQILYGNVGYLILEANINELLREPGDRASWC